MRSSRTWSAKSASRARAAFAAAALAACAGASAHAASADWTAFAPQDGHFAVELPGAPAVEGDSHWTPIGTIAMTKYWMRVGDALLAVEVHDLPAVAAALVSDDRILDEARDSVIRDMRGTLIEGRATEFRGAPARDFRYRLPGKARLEERVVAVLLENRLYLVTGMARAPGSDPAVERFFASFRFWREGQVPAAPR